MFYNNGTLFLLSLSFFYSAKRWSLVETGSLRQVCGWFDTAAAAPLCTPPVFPRQPQ